MATEIKFTPMQQKLMEILGDEQRHEIIDVHNRVYDSHDPVSLLHTQMSLLRNVIRPKGMDVACVTLNNRQYYQLVRLTANAYDGRR